MGIRLVDFAKKYIMVRRAVPVAVSRGGKSKMFLSMGMRLLMRTYCIIMRLTYDTVVY
jgi:hypothetical protein